MNRLVELMRIIERACEEDPEYREFFIRTINGQRKSATTPSPLCTVAAASPAVATAPAGGEAA